MIYIITIIIICLSVLIITFISITKTKQNLVTLKKNGHNYLNINALVEAYLVTEDNMKNLYQWINKIDPKNKNHYQYIVFPFKVIEIYYPYKFQVKVGDYLIKKYSPKFGIYFIKLNKSQFEINYRKI